MIIDFQQVIKNFQDKANIIYNDNTRLRELLEAARRKAEGNKELMELWSDIKLLIELIKDWIKGDYKDLTKNTATMIIIALLYLVSPIDLIPDFLIGGFLDDALVIGYVVKKITAELNVYREWKGVTKDDIIEEVMTDGDIFED